MQLRFRFRDEASPKIDQALRSVRNRRGLFARLGKELEDAFRDHFDQRDQEPNARGWPSKGFWGDISDATQLTGVSDRGAKITIGGGEGAKLGFKYRGGTIRPKRAKALAIPETKEAYMLGSPREHDQDVLRAIYFESRGDVIGALIKRREPVRDGVRRRRPQGPGTPVRPKRLGRDDAGSEPLRGVWYWLLRKADHPKDPRALPERRAVEARLKKAAQVWAERVLRRAP